jgi:hypothetical protein
VVEAASTPATVVPASCAYGALVRRLLTDPRMERVWKQLSKLNRSTETYLHPSPRWLPREWEALREEFQDRALAALFLASARRVSWNRMTWESKHRNQHQPYREWAAQLRAAAEQGRALGIQGKHIKQIEAAAAAGDLAGPPDENLIRGYLAGLAGDMKDLFGTPLYGTVATIASVALEQPITVKMVRKAVDTTNTPCP